nr:MAG TPA: hypothetical protein [Caudoviricetes sp.]
MDLDRRLAVTTEEGADMECRTGFSDKASKVSRQRSPGPQGGSIPLPSGHAAMRLYV